MSSHPKSRSEEQRKVVDRAAAAAAIDAFLRAIGRGDDADVHGTGERVTEMFLADLCAGYAVDTRKLIADNVIEVANASAPAMVVVRDIPVVTMCPHHLLPAIGTAVVAFKAQAHIVGLGSIVGLVDAHARRLSLQERIGEAVVDDLEAVLKPAWVGCRLVLAHGCMIARGERATGTRVETLALRGPPHHAAEAHLALGGAVTAGDPHSS